MNLNQSIRDTIEQLRDALPADITAKIEMGAGEISALSIAEGARSVGQSAPEFALKDRSGETKTLKSYLADGLVILTFYRGAWCPYCNLQLRAYQDHLDAFRTRGAQLVAITPETPNAIDDLLASDLPDGVIDDTAAKVEFDVLHDAGNTVARQFGLVFDMPDSHKDVISGFGLDLEAINGEGGWAVADPATYILTPDGQIAWAFIPNNYRKRAEPEAILRALDDINRSN